jgi:hypothetical protein
MLQITIPAAAEEQFDDTTSEFITLNKEQTLQLEHSLVSLSKWESSQHKPFLTKDKKSREESIEYIRCMTLTQNVGADVYNFVTNSNIDEVSKYIEESMTATTFAKAGDKVTNRKVITAEIIYYWMITLNVPFECQKWHLNRLLTLINVCNLENQPLKKLTPAQVAERNRALNEARRKQLNTTG